MTFATLDGRRIEYRLIPGAAAPKPTIVLLHEGLGCIALWREFPERLARRTGLRTLVYSRFGYGQSDGLQGPRTVDFMHEEARDVLPALLATLGIERPLLVGHSDGGSIALIYAGDHPVAGLALMAPHAFVEDVTVRSIAHVRETFETSGLRGRLAKYHAHVEDAFFGWADIWLDPAFRDWSIEAACRQIAAPMLLIQGRDDEYGTLAQVERIKMQAQGPAEILVLENCGHSPHRDREAAVLDAVAGFAAGLA
ncbi:MAG: alpha/beta fold hydrolase [Hyphomicrobiaceae bacterium]